MKTRAFLLLLPIGLLLAQTDRLQFEVASVRSAAPFATGENPSKHGGPGTSDPGTVTYRAVALRDLILEVYGIQWLQLTIPEQFYFKLRYDIVAKIPTGTTTEQFDRMMQNLLAERFELRFHRQPKQFDTYKLTVGKGGPKLNKTTFTSEFSAEDPSKRVARRDPDGAIYAPGNILTQPKNGRLLMSAGKMSMNGLARDLQIRLGGPVTDATGLTGEYDIKLEFSPEGMTLAPATSGALAKGKAPDAASDPVPNIFQALEQQLGLRLEKSTAMLDLLVVDHLDEVPTEN